jgi:hypothetical protein
MDPWEAFRQIPKRERAACLSSLTSSMMRLVHFRYYLSKLEQWVQFDRKATTSSR